MAQRQTLSYLRNLFDRRGISPKYRFGQNFLIDLNIHELIAETAEVGPDDVVLEVGPGAGALTRMMADTQATVVAVDIDRDMADLTTEATIGLPNVRVLNIDALAGKNRLNPILVDSVKAGLAAREGRNFKLVANLPYNVATPIIGNVLVHPDLHPERMVITIQLELAQRMMAEPDSSDYSALTVLIQGLADVSLVRTLPPSVFWPKPNVESAIIMIRPSAEKQALIEDIPWFHTFIRRVFLLRRKNLRRALYSLWRDSWTDKQEVDALLDGLGHAGLVRAEALTIPQLRDLAAALRPKLSGAIEE